MALLDGVDLDGRIGAVAARLGAGRTVGQIAAESGLGERALHRLARRSFGYGPKTLARIQRFQRAFHVDEAKVAGPASQDWHQFFDDASDIAPSAAFEDLTDTLHQALQAILRRVLVDPGRQHRVRNPAQRLVLLDQAALHSAMDILVRRQRAE